MTNKIKILILITQFIVTNQVMADYPIVSHRYLADPGALVYKDRVYLYCSNDSQNPVEGGYKMRSIVCVSSNDLKNWTDHGIVFQVSENTSWAENSWAPSPAERDGKFYLYFGNGGKEIGVAVSDSPTGSFTDPIGGSLININTPGVQPADNLWLFDPMTFVDDDGQAYIYFGGNGKDNMRIIKLNNDMISAAIPASRFEVPYFFEASWMHKYNGKYYFSYSTNPRNGMRIDYMISDNPLTGFTYGGVVSQQPPNNDNNNHHSIFKFQGEWYQAYHNRIVAIREGIPPGFRRNLCLDKIYHNEDGSIETMVNTVDGIAQLKYLNPYLRVEAETMSAHNGIETGVCTEGGMCVVNIENDDWIKVRGVDFGTFGAAAFTASIASEIKVGNSKVGSIEIRIDEADGKLIGTLPVSNTGGTNNWKLATTALIEVIGVHDVFLVFTSEIGRDLFNIDYWYFTEKAKSPVLISLETTIDDYKIDTSDKYNTTNVKVKAIYKNGTSKDITSESSFSVNNENISFTAKGLIKGENFGVSTLTVSYNGKKDSIKIIVKDLKSEFKVTRLLIDNKDFKIFSGGYLEFKLFAEFEDGHLEDVTNKANYNIPIPKIASFSKGNIVAGCEGEMDITASYKGKLGDAESKTLHVAVYPRKGIWLEAECGQIGSLWNVVKDETAANGEFVTTNSQNNSIDVAPTDSNGLITYRFNLETGGTFKLFARVICQNSKEDSFWIKLDDGEFFSWNNVTSSVSWTWAGCSETLKLKNGVHTLKIGYREVGAKLDKLWISTDLDVKFTDQGNIGSNCKGENILN